MRNTKIILSTVVTGVLLAGCNIDNLTQRVDDSNSTNNYNSIMSMKFNLDDYNITTDLVQEMKDSLTYMKDEERLASDLYLNLYNYYKNYSDLEIKQLNNIATNTENDQISIIKSLVKRYDLNSSEPQDVNISRGVYENQVIQDLYDKFYAIGQNSQEEALKVGCMVEVTDINDLDKYISLAKESNATDIETAFKALRDGSYHNYWTFDQTLKNLGVTDGCYDEENELLTNKEEAYPKNNANAKKYMQNHNDNSEHAQSHNDNVEHTQNHNDMKKYAQNHKGNSEHTQDHKGNSEHAQDHNDNSEHTQDHNDNSEHTQDHNDNSEHTQDHNDNSEHAQDHKGNSEHAQDHNDNSEHTQDHNDNSEHTQDYKGNSEHTQNHNGKKKYGQNHNGKKYRAEFN